MSISQEATSCFLKEEWDCLIDSIIPCSLSLKVSKEKYWSGINFRWTEVAFDCIKGFELDMIGSISSSWDVDG
jgi:hypothetical protein